MSASSTGPVGLRPHGTPGTAPAIPPVPPAPAAGMSTRARDKDALVHIFEVLTDTLRPSSKKANPYHLIRDHVTIDTTSDFFALDQDFLDADIPLYSDYDNGILQLDAKGNAMTFTLGTKEKQRLLAVSIFWDMLCAQTPGGIPGVDQWYTLTNATLDAALRNAIAGQSRVAPLHAAGPTGTNFEKGTRRSVSDYKVFRDRKTWNQFQRGLLATAHMQGPYRPCGPRSMEQERKFPIQCLHNGTC
jgi:hypothetical protein